MREPGTGLLLTPSLAVACLAVLLLLWERNLGLVGLLAVPLAATAVLLIHEAAGRRDPVRLMVLTLTGLGLGVSMGVDLVTVEGDIGRMNTVFKFYLQVWTLFALASAYGVWWLARRLARRPVTRTAWTAALALLVLGAGLYPLRAVPARVDERFVALPPGLDGTEYMAHAVYQDEHGPLDLRYDEEAIRWLREHVEGTPVIMEGHAPAYRWGGRYSVYTGLPAVIGWEWHQKQQRWRYQAAVNARMEDVKRFYSSQDPNLAAAIARRYGVRYVVVGQLERAYYPPEGIAKFEAGRVPGLEPVFRNDGVTIYEVRDGTG